MPEKKVLIVCHNFPPYPGIGGRRWAKFAKYLDRKGYEVFVIAAENPYQEKSSWTQDTRGKNINISYLPLNYPVVLLDTPTTFFSKIKYRMVKLYYESTQPKRVFDKSFLWEKPFIDHASKLIEKEKIKNIIVTGSPFYLMEYAADLKKKYPQLNYIADYRDPWISGVNYGMSGMSRKKSDLEREIQNNVYAQVDYITAPNTFLLNEIKASMGNVAKSEKFIELTHAYDTDDIQPYISDPVSSVHKQKIRFTYGGSLYNGTEPILEDLNRSLHELKKLKPDLYQKIQFDFYTPDANLLNLLEDHKEVVTFYSTVGQEIFKHISASDFCLIILPDHKKDYCTTKFYEIMALKKPFIILGEEGYVSEFVTTKKLGYYIKNDLFVAHIQKIINDLSEGKLNYSPSENIDPYSFDKVTDRLIDLLK